MHLFGIPVYNFRVAEFHTYFVSATADLSPLLVHNADYVDPKNAPDTGGSAASTFELPRTWRSARGVSGKFSDGKHTFRIDTNNLGRGERFHVHIYDANGREIAVIQGTGTNGVWREAHRGQVLKKPSEVSSQLLTDIRRLLRNALNNIK